VRLEDSTGKSAGSIDVVLLSYDAVGRIIDNGSLEVQAVYISGNVSTPTMASLGKSKAKGRTSMSEREAKWVTAYLSLGANLGNKQETIGQALKELAAQPTIKVVAVSSLYQTTPVGLTDQPDFLNAAAAIQTTLTPQELLAHILQLEQQLGRVRTVRWGPRTIDIDILTFGSEEVNQPKLTIPHPRLAERLFALVPLAEIAPDLRLPGDSEPMQEKAARFAQQGNILWNAVV